MTAKLTKALGTCRRIEAIADPGHRTAMYWAWERDLGLEQGRLRHMCCKHLRGEL